MALELVTRFAPAPASALAVAQLPAAATEAALLAVAPVWLKATGVPPHLTHPQRRREWLAGRLLAASLVHSLGAADVVVADEFNRPHLHAADSATRTGAVSLTHGGGCVAALVALGAGRRVGLDLEPERPKTLALAPRWLAADELLAVGHAPERAALAWSLKETLYKLYGRRQLDFRAHLHLALGAWAEIPGTLPEAGAVDGRIQHPAGARTWQHRLHYMRPAAGSWLTYCVSDSKPLTSSLS